MLFEGYDLSLVLLPYIILVALLTLVSRKYFWKEAEKSVRLFNQFRLELALAAAFFVILLASLPFFPALMSFHNPQTIRDVASSQQILSYLQIYNREIVRVVQVVFWMILEIVILLSIIYNYLKSHNDLRNNR